jgi:AcrR family transcriptional regulator
MTAEDRRVQILDVAVSEFANKGLYGTSTETIADKAGVSQPYLFRLFGTKRELFLAAADLCFDRVRETFTVAAESNPENRLAAMGAAYKRLVSQRHLLLMQLQSYAASSDDVVRSRVSRRYADLFRHVVQVSGESADQIRSFFAVGMLLNVTLATGTESLLDSAWLDQCFEDVKKT